MRYKIPSYGVVLFIANLWLLTGSIIGWAQGLTNALTPDQVTCDELQLERLQKRFVVIEDDPASGGNARNPSLFLWRSSLAGGMYSGLAVTSLIGRVRDEEQLALDLFTRQYGERLNPRRPLIPQATLVRRNQDSDLVPDLSRSLTVSLDVVGQPVADPYVPIVPLIVNNLSSPSGRQQPLPVADGVGRGIGLDGLADACHGAFTPFDEKVFGIISRTLRASACTPRTGCHPADPTAYNVTVFRGTDPQTYRADVYLYSKTCSDDGLCEFNDATKVALEIRVSRDENGKVGTGQVKVLPLCVDRQTSGCSSYDIARVSLYVLPPLFAGHEQQGQDVINAAALVVVESTASPDNVLSATVDWQALLANSVWN